MDGERAEVVRHDPEQAERAGVARQAHAVVREDVPELVVPQVRCQAAGQAQPAPVGFRFRERPQCLRERGDARGVALGEPRGERVEEHVARVRCGPTLRRTDGFRHLALARTGPEAPRVHGRRHRLEVGLAGHRGVERVQPPGRLKQQRRRIATAPGGERDLRTQPLQPRALELVDRRELGGAEKRGRGLGVGHVELGLRRVEQAVDAHRRVRRQLGRSLQERGGGRQPAAALCAIGRAGHLRRHRLVGHRGRVRAMPRPPVGIEFRVGHLGERVVNVAAVTRVRRPVHRRADQRMREAHAQFELDQPGRLRRLPRVHADAEQRGGPPQHARVPHRLGRGRQEQQLRVARQRPDTLEESVFDAARQPARFGKAESARELRRRQAAWELDQRERVSPRLGEDLRSHARVDQPGDRRGQQRLGGIVRQSLDHQFRQSRECIHLAGLAQREHEAQPLGQQPARHEGERLRGHPVEPLRVVDDAHQRLFLGDVGQQAQDRQTDEETVRWRPCAQAERGRQCVSLRDRETPEPAEHRRAQCMQAGERELHLRLHAGGVNDPATSGRGVGQVPQQRALADSRLTSQDQHATLARTNSGDDLLEPLALAHTVQQPR